MTEDLLFGLRSRIKSRTAVLGVIGLGYVGSPVAALFADAGFQVIGVDRRADRVALINDGRSPVKGREPGLTELLKKVVDDGKLVAAAEYESLYGADVVLIAVETPVSENYVPQFESLSSALTSLASELGEGTMVIVESTIAPGTMEELVRPLLEQGSGLLVNEGFFMGHCPERVMPGKLLHNLKNLGRVCGGYSPETSELMVELYQHIVDADLDVADCVTAELVKTAENTYRDVNIAFANELALICEAAGGDVWKVRELVNKVPGRNVLLPGAGVGGHCLPKDPWLLAAGGDVSRSGNSMIQAARAMNDQMPDHMVQLLIDSLHKADQEISKARVLIMGYSYLENSADIRNSPSRTIAERLRKLGARIVIHDPWVEKYQGNLQAMAEGCNAALVLVRHQEYEALDPRQLASWMATPIIIDGRHIFARELAEAPDIAYRVVGVADI